MSAGAEPFVGRGTELELLAASLEAAAEGKPRFVFVAGEAGIGKTRLLREAAAAAAPLGLRVLSGTAIEGGRAMPYLPLLASLTECVDGARDAAAEVVRQLITGERSPDAPDIASAARVAESIFSVLARQPTLLLVDDLQWADSSSVAVLDYISHRARSESLAVVGAARDDEPERFARLPLANGRRFTRLAVGRLSRAEVEQQVGSLLGRAPEPDFLSTVFERSAGNPFFVEQLLATNVIDTPPSLRALVLARLAELPERDRRIIEALAVIGRPADEALVARVAGVGEDEARQAAREAARRGITIPADEGIAFRHPLFPEVVLAELSGPTRRRLHRTAALALAAGSAAAPAEIATHWWEAGDDQRAWPAALDAAEHAERNFAFAEARLHLERALQAWPSGAEGLTACLLRTAHAAWLAGDPAAALDLAQRARAEGAPDDAELQIAVGRYASEAGRMAVSDAAFKRATALVREGDPGATRALALWGLARVRINEGRFAEARDVAEEAVKLARDAGDLWVEAAALFARGMSFVFEGSQSLHGLVDIERGVALAVEAQHPTGTGRGYDFLTIVLHLTGHADRALELALDGVEACEALGVAGTHGSDLRGRAALILLELGRWDEAEAVLAPAEARALPVLASALLAMRRGHFGRAQMQISGEAGDPASAPDEMLYLLPAELAWLRGDPATARATLEAMPEGPGIWGAAAAAEAARLEARLSADEPRRDAPRTAPQARHPDPKVDAALRAEIDAEMTRRSGAADPELWSVCTRAWAVANRPYDRAYARLREAEALFSVGARESAKDVLRDAAAAASALGARPLRGLADELARRARVSSEPPRPRESHRDEPTRRELDVLTLLAEGLTNREIAARLFLSPRTVGIHVSRLHQKLDAHTRGEAVAVARRRGILV